MMTVKATGGVRLLEPDVDVDSDLDRQSQVVLFNDDHNSFDHVISCLSKVFGHPSELAMMIAKDAHERGKTIAQVEDHENAVLHKQQLQSFGLTAEVEKI